MPDGAALQAAINAAPAGGRVTAEPGSVIDLTAPLDLSTAAADLTVDLQGAGIRAGATRTGRLATVDQHVLIGGRTGLRLLNGRLLPPLSPPAVGGEQIQLIGSTGCTVAGWECYGAAGSMFCTIRQGRLNRIRRNHVRGTGVSVVASCDNDVDNNLLEDSAANAISLIGFASTGNGNGRNRVRRNRIVRYGRIGIEDHSPDGRQWTADTEISGNTIDTYSAAVPNAGQGISAMGWGARIRGNSITDASGWGIETVCDGGRIVGNDVLWSTPEKGAASMGIVLIETSPGNPRRTTVCSENAITNPKVGIWAYSQAGKVGPLIAIGNAVSGAQGKPFDFGAAVAESYLAGNVSI